MRERKCIVSNEVMPETELIRFVVDMEANVLPDIRAKAPGRGVWVGAKRELLDEAIAKRGFARGFKSQVKVPDDLTSLVEQQLRVLCLDLMGMARRSGQLVGGFEKVRSAIRAQKPGWLIEAENGSADGRNKILGLCRGVWDEVPLVGCFDDLALGKALGREHVGHVFMNSGAIATRFGLQLHRLSGFTPLTPLHWGKKDG